MYDGVGCFHTWNRVLAYIMVYSLMEPRGVALLFFSFQDSGAHIAEGLRSTVVIAFVNLLNRVFIR